MANITRWDPFSGITDLHSQIDDMFKDLFNTSWPATTISPAMDLYTEDDKNLVAEFHVPGFNSEDVDINVRNNTLEVKGEKHDKQEDSKKRNYMRRESYASFYRSIVLPKNADSDSIKASFDDGVLRVTVPMKELPAPKKIAIESKKK